MGETFSNQPLPGHASSHGRITTSAIKASVLQVPACWTVYHRTCDETWTLRVSSVNWKHFYSGVSQPRRIMTLCLILRLRNTLTYLLTYLHGQDFTFPIREKVVPLFRFFSELWRVLVHFHTQSSPHDYAVLRCPFICPSVIFGYWIETSKHIFKLFSPLGSPTISGIARGATRVNAPPLSD